MLCLKAGRELSCSGAEVPLFKGLTVICLFSSDFDECEAGAKCNDDQFCFNTYGGQRCIPKLKCYTNYENMSDT